MPKISFLIWNVDFIKNDFLPINFYKIYFSTKKWKFRQKFSVCFTCPLLVGNDIIGIRVIIVARFDKHWSWIPILSQIHNSVNCGWKFPIVRRNSRDIILHQFLHQFFTQIFTPIFYLFYNTFFLVFMPFFWHKMFSFFDTKKCAFFTPIFV